MTPYIRNGLLALCTMLASPAFADVAIGHVLSLTGAGSQAGREMSAGAKVYVDKVNAAGGVDGHKIVYLVRDDAGQAAQALARTSELIAKDHVIGLLEGANRDNLLAVAGSGMLTQNNVPMVGMQATAQGIAAARQVGLVEVVPPQRDIEPVVDEFKHALEKYGPADLPASAAALQGYLAAKVLVGGLRILGPTPSRAEFYALMRAMVVDVSTSLVVSNYPSK